MSIESRETALRDDTAWCWSWKEIERVNSANRERPVESSPLLFLANTRERFVSFYFNRGTSLNSLRGYLYVVCSSRTEFRNVATDGKKRDVAMNNPKSVKERGNIA